MHSANKRAFFGDFAFDVCEEVYDPSEDSFLFAENLRVEQGARVLDMGTGSGILGILAATRASAVLEVDVNPYAIRCAKQNAALNRVGGNMAFLQGDLFAPLGETAKFDLILFNAPYLPSEKDEEETWLGRAWAGGANGREVIDRFIIQAPAHLERDGRILLLQSTLSNVEETQSKFAELKTQAKIIVERSLPFFEKLVLLEAEQAH
jgi:release factor glutamine methyltransferase